MRGAALVICGLILVAAIAFTVANVTRANEAPPPQPAAQGPR
jgi:hypothetical protein